MKDLYGFKKMDVLNLIEFVKERKGESLSSIFEKYAKSSGKAKGTVRNLYYTITKISNTNKEFCEKYLGGKPISVEEKVEFLPCQEKALLKQIIKMRADGVSVRKAVRDLAKGDEKLALRYQNKFRSMLRTNASLVNEIISEVKNANGNAEIYLTRKYKEPKFNEVLVGRLKKEINSLFDKTFIELKKENYLLKEEIISLTDKNAKLRKLLYGNEKLNDVAEYFLSAGQKGLYQ